MQNRKESGEAGDKRDGELHGSVSNTEGSICSIEVPTSE